MAEHNLRAISRALLARAKAWWYLSLGTRVLVIVAGGLAVLDGRRGGLIGLLVLFLAIATELFQWRSDAVKRISQKVLRNLDWEDSLGWRISKVEIADTVAKCPKAIREKSQKPCEVTYFASQSPPGTKRLLENTLESSWWSKHLFLTMWISCATVSVAMLLFSLFLLVVSIRTLHDPEVLEGVGRIAASIVVGLSSLGALRLTVGYFIFHQVAQDTSREADLLLEDMKNKDTTAIKLLYEYQLQRALSPLIPDFVYRLRRDYLNKLWSQYIQRQS